MKIKITNIHNDHWYIIAKHPKKDFKGFYNVYVKKELTDVDYKTHIMSEYEYDELCRGKKQLNA